MAHSVFVKPERRTLADVSDLPRDQPFFTQILGAGNSKRASTFIPKCTNLTAADRIEMWVKCGMLVKAGEEALKTKDLNALELLKSKATGSVVGDIERIIAQLRPKR